MKEWLEEFSFWLQENVAIVGIVFAIGLGCLAAVKAHEKAVEHAQANRVYVHYHWNTFPPGHTTRWRCDSTHCADLNATNDFDSTFSPYVELLEGKRCDL